MQDSYVLPLLRALLLILRAVGGLNIGTNEDVVVVCLFVWLVCFGLVAPWWEIAANTNLSFGTETMR